MFKQNDFVTISDEVFRANRGFISSPHGIVIDKIENTIWPNTGLQLYDVFLQLVEPTVAGNRYITFRLEEKDIRHYEHQTEERINEGWC